MTECIDDTIFQSSSISLDDYSTDNKVCHWSEAYLIGNVFNDLMNKMIENEDGIEIESKYIYQAITKFRYFRIGSDVTYFDISQMDLSDQTKGQLLRLIQNCKLF